MFFYSFTFINNYIRAAPEANSCISFNDLLKNASLEEIPNICSLRFTRIHDNESVELWKLHQGYRTSIIPFKSNSCFPFLLIPLFKIKDYNKQEVHYTFFKNCEFNIIYDYGIKVLLGLHNDILVEDTHMKMYHGGKVIALNQFVHEGKNGYFIFKDPNSDCAMLYYGVLIDSYILKNPTSKLAKLYDYYILKKNFNEDDPTFSNSLNPEDIIIELQLDIEKLNKNKEGLVYHKNEKSDCFLFDLKLNKISLNIGFKIILKGKIKDNHLYFDVYKYYGHREINDIHVTMNLKSDEESEFYRKFIQSLKV